jgi:hypothetical protein
MRFVEFELNDSASQLYTCSEGDSAKPGKYIHVDDLPDFLKLDDGIFCVSGEKLSENDMREIHRALSMCKKSKIVLLSLPNGTHITKLSDDEIGLLRNVVCGDDENSVSECPECGATFR